MATRLGTRKLRLTARSAGPIAEHEAVGEGDDEHDGDDEDRERDLPVEQTDAGASLVRTARFTTSGRRTGTNRGLKSSKA